MAIIDSVAVLSAPETQPSIDRIRVDDVHITRKTTTATVELGYIDTADELRRSFTITLSTGADVLALIAAIGSTRPGETGTIDRRFNFRVLGFLVDSGRLAGVTLAP